MAAITDTSNPLVFPVNAPDAVTLPPASLIQAGWSAVRTCSRALEGMQKEAIVSESPSGGTWRMVCDEGPYLNGTDLAPFPLAFFCTGMVTSYLQEVQALLAKQGIAYTTLGLQQDNYYSMEGSAVAGTMTGSALPVELNLVTDAVLTKDQTYKLLTDAIAASPVGALLREHMTNTFSITCQDQPLEPARVPACTSPTPASLPDFNGLQPDTTSYPDDIITKLKSAQLKTGVAGGVGSSLTDSQKRVLHMRGNCQLLDSGLMETTVELFSPLGSQFRFLADISPAFGGKGRAPSGLAYLNAGLAFCYMTQIGRYSHIVRKPLDAYFLVQDMQCSAPGASGKTAKPAEMSALETHVVVECTHPSDFVTTLVDMSEQTCFLHAACRNPVKVKLRLQE